MAKAKTSVDGKVVWLLEDLNNPESGFFIANNEKELNEIIRDSDYNIGNVMQVTFKPTHFIRKAQPAHLEKLK